MSRGRGHVAVMPGRSWGQSRGLGVGGLNRSWRYDREEGGLKRRFGRGGGGEPVKRAWRQIWGHLWGTQGAGTQ